VAFAILGDDRLGLRVGEVCDSLLGAEVNLTQIRSLAALIIEKVWLPKRCMLAEALRDTAIGHDDGDLM